MGESPYSLAYVNVVCIDYPYYHKHIPSMKNINFTAIDVETATASRMICQIGIVQVEQGIIVREESLLIQPPGNKYDENCIRIHHITPENTIAAPTFKEIWPKLEPYLKCQLIVCHSEHFDMDAIKRNMEYYNIPEIPILGITCTYNLFQLKLEHVAKAFDIQLTNHHDALADAKCCAEIFLKYLQGLSMDHSKISYSDIYSSDMNKYKRDLQEYKNNRDYTWTYRIKSTQMNPESSIFYGKNIVITGELDIERELLKDLITNLGGKILSGISKKLDILILGAFPGPVKMKTVEDLVNQGIPIRYMPEKELLNHISDYIEKYNRYENN